MDIFNLKRSKTREKILKLYFTNPSKKYYLRELERVLSLPVGNVRRELMALEKSGLFSRGKMGNQVYYYLNTSSPLFNDFNHIISDALHLGKKEKKASKKSVKKEDLMVIERDDFEALVSKISELENTLEHLMESKGKPKKVKEKKAKEVVLQPKFNS